MKRFILLVALVCSLAIKALALDPVEVFGKTWEKLTKEEHRALWKMRVMSTYEPTGAPSVAKLESYIATFAAKNILDPKVTVFDVKVEDRGGTVCLSGDVLFPNHKSGLERVLNVLGFDKMENNIRVLPDPALGDEAFGVATSPTVSMKRNPGIYSEQVNQVLYGAPLRLLKRDVKGKYFLAQSPDAYIGWVGAGDIRRMKLKEWSVLRKTLRDDSASREKLLKFARPVMGIPYTWGGISERGMDCSGFTQCLYRMRGINLPRDADEQSVIGELVAFGRYRENLCAGDLLFFCTRTGRIGHVAISLGGMEFLQATRDGAHRSSFDPDSPIYDAHANKGFIFARRIFRDGF